MPSYVITMSPAAAGGEVEVNLQGPGIQPSGKQYIFATTARCEAFVEAVNFAYQQGVRDGDRGVWLVGGSTPDDLLLRRERWWERVKRHWRLHRMGL